MKQNGLLLVAAIAAAMLVGCTPETVEPQPQAPAESEPLQNTTEPVMPKTLVGTQWLDHEDYWASYPSISIHYLIDYRLIFIDDSTVIYNGRSDGAENFPAADISQECSYTYNPETGRLVMSTEAASQAGTYSVDLDALVFDVGTIFYREY